MNLTFQKKMCWDLEPLTFAKMKEVAFGPQVINFAKKVSEGRLTEEQYKKQKKNLPAIVWQATFKNNRRNATNSSDNVCPTGLYFADFDNMECDIDKLYEERIKPFIQQLDIVIVKKSISGKGLHIVGYCQEQFETIEQNQIWLAEKLNLEAYRDKCVTDWARCCFFSPANYWYYINKEIFD